tara:strand:- start:333 stop:815 length:483 start_codon:yes stop_codon:yes gene_type:complete
VVVVLRYIADKILYSGDGNLRGYEVATLKAFRNCLNVENAQKFDMQILKLSKVQRWQGGKTTAFFDYKDEMKEQWPHEIAFFDGDDNDGIVAKVSLSIAEKKATAKIEFYKGYLLYIKFTYEMGLLQKQYKRNACSLDELTDCRIDDDIVVKTASLLKEQ